MAKKVTSDRATATKADSDSAREEEAEENHEVKQALIDIVRQFGLSYNPLGNSIDNIRIQEQHASITLATDGSEAEKQRHQALHDAVEAAGFSIDSEPDHYGHVSGTYCLDFGLGSDYTEPLARLKEAAAKEACVLDAISSYSIVTPILPHQPNATFVTDITPHTHQSQQEIS